MRKHQMQLIFGLPILIFALMLVSFDAFGICDIGKFGYAFFGGVITHLLYYFFRKAVPTETEGEPTAPPSHLTE